MVPSPGTYNIPTSFGHERQDFNRSKYSSMFQKPIAEQPVSPRSIVPGPNQYDVKLVTPIICSRSNLLSLQIDQGLKKISKTNNVAAQAAFRSHTKRPSEEKKSFITPAPGSFWSMSSISIGSIRCTKFQVLTISTIRLLVLCLLYIKRVSNQPRSVKHLVLHPFVR